MVWFKLNVFRVASITEDHKDDDHQDYLGGPVPPPAPSWAHHWLDMAIRRNKNALDMKGEEIAHELMMVQKKIEFQYEQKIHQLNRKLERQHESWYEDSSELSGHNEPGSDSDMENGKCNNHS